MADDIQAKLETIDIAILRDVIQQDQRTSSLEITKWSVKRLSDKGIMNPDGLWLFSGEGYDETGSRHWSVVLKVLTRQENEPPLSNMWHWKREFFIARSGLIKNLSDSLKAPRIYKVEETTEGAWLWLENIENSPS